MGLTNRKSNPHTAIKKKNRGLTMKYLPHFYPAGKHHKVSHRRKNRERKTGKRGEGMTREEIPNSRRKMRRRMTVTKMMLEMLERRSTAGTEGRAGRGRGGRKEGALELWGTKEKITGPTVFVCCDAGTWLLELMRSN